jgi:arylmalonate decarboxylase
MASSRREVLKAGVAGGLAWALAAPARAGEPVIGMIFPPANYPVPAEAKELYPTGITFLAKGVGLPGGMTIAGYDEAIPRVVPAAVELASQGANGISVMGTSLTFYKGAAFNQEIIDKVHAATGLPATTMSTGIVQGLKIANAKKVTLATAYTDIVTERLKAFLEESGFQIVAAKGMGYETIPPGAVNHDVLMKFGEETYRGGPASDALVISCGALPTLDVLAPLEAKIGVPIVSSRPHALMDAVRLVGRSGRALGYGSVLAKA